MQKAQDRNTLHMNEGHKEGSGGQGVEEGKTGAYEF